MGWLEDTLASIAASGEGAVNLGPQLTEREREMMALVKGGGYGVPDVTNPGIRMAMGDGPMPYASGSIPFSIGGDPMTAGGMSGNGPGLPFAPGGDPMTAGGAMRNGPGLPFAPGSDPMTAGGPPPFSFDPMTAGGGMPNGISLDEQLAMRLRAGNPALSFPTSQPTEKYIDYASGFPIEMTRPKAQFGDIPGGPAGPPAMPEQAGLAGLNSPFGGGGAPFSIAGSPSLVAAKEMAAPPPPAPPPGGPPPPMTQQAAIPGLVPPGAAPGVPAPALVAQGGDGGDGDTPAGAPTDASARRRDVAPAAAAAATAAAIPALARPAATSFLDRLGEGLNKHGPMLMALGAGMAGAPSFGEGISRGLAAATPYGAARQKTDEALALQAQQANVTARLLASKGATPQEIAAAVAGGPEVMKALVAQYLGKDKFKVVQTGENDRGRKTFQVFNEQDSTFKAIPGAEVQADNASEAAAAAGITGDNFLKTVPNAQDRSLIKQLTNYDLDPGKLSAKGGNRERLLALAEQFDPDYKAVLYAPRAAALKEFIAGGQNSPASIITNGNTAIQHLGRMSELAAKLGGTNNAWLLNGVVNWANVTLEDMKNNPDLAKYKGAEDRFVEEATKFYRGVGGNKADIERALGVLKPSQSPQARQAAIEEQADLMQSKVNALQDRFKTAMGPSGWKKAIEQAGTEFPIVQQKSAEELDKIRRRAAGDKVGGAAVKPGNYVYRNGVLVPE